MCSGTQYLKLKMMGSLYHYVRTASMGGAMSDAMYDLLYIVEAVTRTITMVVIMITCYCYTNGFKKRR